MSPPKRIFPAEQSLEFPKDSLITKREFDILCLAAIQDRPRDEREILEWIRYVEKTRVAYHLVEYVLTGQLIPIYRKGELEKGSEPRYRKRKK